MNTPTHPASRGRRRRGLLAVATVAALAAAAFPVVGNAQAASGRRICEYSFKVRPAEAADPLMKFSLGMNYKKDGKCPALNRDALAATGYVDAYQVFPNPVPKWTCEDWGKTHETWKNDLGEDPCENMWEDRVFVFYWQDPTTPNAEPPSYADLGDYSLFR